MNSLNCSQFLQVFRKWIKTFGEFKLADIPLFHSVLDQHFPVFKGFDCHTTLIRAADINFHTCIYIQVKPKE